MSEFICRFLRRTHSDSTTHVEFTGTTRGRQKCPARGFLFAISFDPIFSWLQDAIIPRNLDDLDFLQPGQCAYADDLGVAASSFRDLMTALAPIFHSVDHIAGLNLNYRQCCWVQFGGESVALAITVKNFPRCRLSVMPSTLGRMVTFIIGRHSEKIIQRVLKIKSDCATSRSIRCLSYVILAPHAHLTKPLSKLRPMPFNVRHTSFR